MAEVKARIEKYHLAEGSAAAPFGADVERNMDTGEILSVKIGPGERHPGDSPLLGSRELVRQFDADDARTRIGVESHIVKNASGEHEETHVAVNPAASARIAPDIKDLDPLAPVKVKSAVANDPKVADPAEARK